jgi:hypothetical protein
MLHTSIKCVAAAIAVGSVAVVGVFATVLPVDAAKLKGITCTGFKGNFHATASTRATVAYSGCDGNTGGGSQPIYLPSNGQITWLNGTATNVEDAQANFTETEKDPKNGTCPKGTMESEQSSKVLSDTSGSARVGGKTSSDLCVNAKTGDVFIEPKAKVRIGY